MTMGYVKTEDHGTGGTVHRLGVADEVFLNEGVQQYGAATLEV
jgi:hypothetical protein